MTQAIEIGVFTSFNPLAAWVAGIQPVPEGTPYDLYEMVSYLKSEFFDSANPDNQAETEPGMPISFNKIDLLKDCSTEELKEYAERIQEACQGSDRIAVQSSEQLEKLLKFLEFKYTYYKLEIIALASSIMPHDLTDSGSLLSNQKVPSHFKESIMRYQIMINYLKLEIQARHGASLTIP